MCPLKQLCAPSHGRRGSHFKGPGLKLCRANAIKTHQVPVPLFADQWHSSWRSLCLCHVHNGYHRRRASIVNPIMIISIYQFFFLPVSGVPLEEVGSPDDIIVNVTIITIIRWSLTNSSFCRSVAFLLKKLVFQMRKSSSTKRRTRLPA